MAIAVQPAFQNDGAFQLAQNQGFQTQLFNVWNPTVPPGDGPWTPVDQPGGPWVPVAKPGGPWTPIGV